MADLMEWIEALIEKEVEARLAEHISRENSRRESRTVHFWHQYGEIGKHKSLSVSVIFRDAVPYNKRTDFDYEVKTKMEKKIYDTVIKLLKEEYWELTEA